MHSQAGLAAMLFEGDRRHRFSAFVFQHAGPDDSLRLDDFAIDAVDPMVSAKAAHRQPIGSADAEIHLAIRHRKPVRRKPSLQMFSLTESLKHERARRIEDPRDSQLAIASIDLNFSTHRALSLTRARCSPRRPSVCFSPSTAPNCWIVLSRSAADSNNIRAVNFVLSPSTSKVTVISNCGPETCE